MRSRIPSVTTYKRPTAWSVRWRENGTRHEERGYPTKAEAEARAHQIRDRFRKGLPGVRTPRSVGELAANWWNRYVEAGHVAYATRVSYHTAMRRILATLGEYDAGALTTPHLIEWHADTAKAHSPRLANITLTALSSIYQRNIEWGLIETNPCRGVKRIREVQSSVYFPTHDDVLRLAATAPADRERGMLLVATYTGLRQGELTALRPRDLIDGRIHVTGALARNRQRKAPKTYENRVVPLPPTAAEWLTEYAHSHPTDAPLFPNHDGTWLQTVVWIKNTWGQWRIDAGTPDLQWRHLRHYYAATLASLGVSALTISRYMGHASIATTMDRYGFLLQEDEIRTMQLLESALCNAR